MAKKRQEPEKHSNQERWLLTYADLITLLMIFFVVMYALSRLDAQKFKSLSNSLRIALGGGKNILGEYEGSGMVPLPVATPQELNVAKEDTDDYVTQHGLQNEVNTVVEDRGLVITLQEKLLFEPGRAEINPGARGTLMALAKLLNTLPNYVRVEGHTDNVPAGRGISNWQLSTLRAANIAQILSEQAGLDPHRMSAIGYGDNRPVADNKTLAGRAKNRRVEIVLLSRRYEATERNAR
jgi:chemotaxis protein MotB